MSLSLRISNVFRWRWLLPAAGLVAAFHFLPYGGPALDHALFDAASRHPLRAPPLPDNSALVLVNDGTMALLGRLPYSQRWPYPRAYFAGLLAALDRAGAERIVVDFTFLENSGSEEEDALLAAVAAVLPKVVLASRTGARPGGPGEQGPVFWNAEFRRAHTSYFQASRSGLTDFPIDEDNVARTYVVPGSLAARAYGRAVTTRGGLLRWHGGLAALEARGVPVVPAGHFFVAGIPLVLQLSERVPDFSPEAIDRALQALPPLTGAAADLVRGRVVFVGANASGTFDLKQLPVGKLEPGVLLHWTAWTNLVAGGFVTALPRWTALLASALAAGLLLQTASRRTGLLVPVAVALGLALLLLPGAYAGISFGWYFPPATPLLAVGLVLLGVVTERFWSEQARKREIQAMFGAYVDPGVVAELVRNPEFINLRGEHREATVFFSDLVGFTDLSEKLRDRPELMVEVVNAYLEETSECLLNQGAYVDKYIGDAVMAVFGVPQLLPDHALAACRAALAARRALAGVNQRYAAAVGVTLAVRIGLNTGDMIVANVGSSRKKSYTVMGDAVNLASRLEGANKEFGTEILLGEATARLVAGRMALRPLTRLRVKGKQEAVEVYELVGTPESLDSAQQDFLAAYLPAYAHYSARRFAEAAGDFGRALAARPDDAVTRELLQQCTTYAHTPPPGDWEPILILKPK